jgi:hypothetical protein
VGLLPALMMVTFIIGKFRRQNWGFGIMEEDERSLQQALEANRFAAR